MVGESRRSVPPPIQDRPGVTFKDPDFDDTGWASASLPHDFVPAGAYSFAADPKHGYLLRNESGWYRKEFTLPADWATGATWLHFEGCFQVCDVFLNGKWLQRHSSGYLPFDVRIDSQLLRTGQRGRRGGAAAPNVVAVRTDASFGSGHWYEGGGLVRKVHLIHTPTTLRFGTDGIFAQTAGSTVSADRATVVPTAELNSDDTLDAVVTYALIDRATDRVVSTAETTAVAVGPAAATTVGGITLTVVSPQLWSVQTPALYTLAVMLFDDRTGTLADTVNITIGLRGIDWSAPGGGFALNGEPLHIRGFSHHSDFGGVGAAVPDRINLFRVNALRSLGGNTWRTSHNPYRSGLYDILDSTGTLCWDENRDFARPYVSDMEVLVRRDRNHPSVVIWSAGNEAELYVSGNANETGALFRAATRKWDTTRPFSANQNKFYGAGAYGNDTMDHLSRYLDVEGFSHGSINAPGAVEVHRRYPNRTAISSECCSCQMQRGEVFAAEAAGVAYPESLEQAQCMASCTARVYPYWRGSPSPEQGVIAGSLGVWTLFDYAGEPGHSYDSSTFRVASSFGSFDYAGFAKSAAAWYRALWLAAVPRNDPGRPPLPSTHVVRVSQTWNSPTNGTALLIGVQVFSDLPVVELFLNGESLGTAKAGPGMFASFAKVPYTAGNLTAVGRAAAGGPALSTHTQLSAASPASIELSLDAPSVASGTGTTLLLDGHDAALVRATVRDGAGRVVGTAANLISFVVTAGPARITGVHNGDAASHEPQYAVSRRAYHGLARAIVAVTVDAASGSRDELELLASEIELPARAGRTGSTTVLPSGKGGAGTISDSIVVMATSPGLAPGKVVIPVATDPAVHGVLAVAAASTTLDLSFD